MDNVYSIVFATVGSVLVMAFSYLGAKLILSLCCRREHSKIQDEEHADNNYTIIMEDKQIPIQTGLLADREYM